jgi:hypothetical protein
MSNVFRLEAMSHYVWRQNVDIFDIQNIDARRFMITAEAISSGWEMVKSFVSSGVWAICTTAAILMWRKLTGHYEEKWFYVAGVIAFLAILLFPHGVHLIFDTPQSIMENSYIGEPLVDHWELVKADFFGVLVGAVIGVIGFHWISERSYW